MTRMCDRRVVAGIELRICRNISHMRTMLHPSVQALCVLVAAALAGASLAPCADEHPSDQEPDEQRYGRVEERYEGVCTRRRLDATPVATVCWRTPNGDVVPEVAGSQITLLSARPLARPVRWYMSGPIDRSVRIPSVRPIFKNFKSVTVRTVEETRAPTSICSHDDGGCP